MMKQRRRLLSNLGIPIGTLDVGTEILLKENGADVPFIVIKQGYEGSDVSLAMRKELYPATMVWTETGTFNYPNYAAWKGKVDDWLTNTYMLLLSSKVCGALVNVAVPSSYYSGYSQVANTIQRACFVLSSAELGLGTYSVGDGSAIPYFDAASKRLCTLSNGTAASHWTRSINYPSDFKTYYYVYIKYVTPSGSGAEASKSTSNTMNSYYTRPVLSLDPKFAVKLAA